MDPSDFCNVLMEQDDGKTMIDYYFACYLSKAALGAAAANGNKVRRPVLQGLCHIALPSIESARAALMVAGTVDPVARHKSDA